MSAVELSRSKEPGRRRRTSGPLPAFVGVGRSKDSMTGIAFGKGVAGHASKRRQRRHPGRQRDLGALSHTDSPYRRSALGDAGPPAPALESAERPQISAPTSGCGHQIELLPVQRPRFVQHAVRDGDLPQIVQSRRDGLPRAPPRPCHPSRDTDRPVSDTMQWLPCTGRALRQCGRATPGPLGTDQVIGQRLLRNRERTRVSSSRVERLC